LVFLKVDLIKSSLYTLLFTLILAIFVWNLFPATLLFTVQKSFFVALDIFLIILGALIFLEITRQLQSLDTLVRLIESLSSDIRISTILLAWVMVNFIEGIAGFGTPGAIVGPILVTLGIPPISAAAAVLVGNSTGGAFGAVGTPTRIGFSSLVNPDLLVNAGIYGLVGTLMPIGILWIVSSSYKSKSKFILPALPFALAAGFSHSLFAYFATFFGQELPTIIASVLSFIFLLILVKLNFLLPSNYFPIKSLHSKNIKTSINYRLFLPYIFLIFALVIGKFLLSNLSITIPLLNHKLSLFNPGLIFILVSFFYLKKIPVSQFKSIVSQSFHQSKNSFLVVFIVSIVVQIMIESASNSNNYASMISYFSKIFTNQYLPVTVPFLGAFGSFITGSITVSNLLFGQSTFTAASLLDLPVNKILASQLIGAALGNMIAIADMVAAETVLKLHNHESILIKKIFPVLFLSLITLSMFTLFSLIF